MEKQPNLSRLAFLKELGLKGASLMAVYCAGSTLAGCSHNDDTVTPAPPATTTAPASTTTTSPAATTTSPSSTTTVANAKLTIDLTSTTYAALLKQGGYIVANSMVVANTSKGYVAVTQVCSHEGQKKITLQNDRFYCSAHGALYDLNGKGLNSLGSRGIKVYTVTQSANTLIIN